MAADLSTWHRLDLFLARLRPHREPLTLLVDAVVVAACWNVTYLFRLGFENSRLASRLRLAQKRFLRKARPLLSQLRGWRGLRSSGN